MPRGLLSQDVVMLAKLVSYGGHRPPIARIATDLALSASQVHLSLRRLGQSRLIDDSGRPSVRSAEEFLVHGVKYSFPAHRGEPTRGIPTAYAASPVREQLAATSELPPVWPYAEGKVRGITFEPLHPTAPGAATKDPTLYELLALIDTLRDGRARERQIAERELGARLRKLLHGG